MITLKFELLLLESSMYFRTIKNEKLLSIMEKREYKIKMGKKLVNKSYKNNIKISCKYVLAPK
jgi:hypothetical protein